ncbi:tetratricopeptide repeat protein [candidate division WOR-3 bacterium]|nr:tetratricopeptide repeat protein [candidate division WOR-3 bacterium]
MAKRSSSAYSRSGHKHIHREDAFTNSVQKITQYYVKSPVQATITTLAVIGIIVLAPIVISRFISKGKAAPPMEASIALMNVQQLMQQNQLQAAEDTLRNLIQTQPRSLPGQKAYYYLGEVLYRKQQFAEARQEYARFEEIYPVKESFLKAAAFYAQGNCLEEEQSFPEAIRLYLELPEKYPESSFIPFALLSAGRCMIFSDRLDEAEALFEQMLKDYPESENQPLFFKILGELGKIDAIRHKY